MMKGKVLAFISIAAVLVVGGVYYAGIPLAANHPFVKNFILEKVKNSAPFPVEFSSIKIRVGLLPSIIVKADELAVINHDNTKALLMTNPYLKIRLLPLVFKNIDIVKSEADNILLNVVYDENHQFLLGEYPIKSNSKLNFDLEKLSFHSGNFVINIDDRIQNKRLKWDGEYFDINKYVKDEIIKFSTKSKLYTGVKSATINSDIELALPINKISEDKAKANVLIEGLDLSDFTEYAKTLSNNKITDLYGVINLTSNTKDDKGHKNIDGVFDISKFGVMQKDKASSIYSDFPLKVTYNFNVINDGVKINTFDVLSKNLDVGLTGSVKGTKSKFPNLDLKLAIRDVSGENLLPLFPGEENLNPDFNFYKLKEHAIYGKATGNIEIKGPADYPNLYGSALLKDVYLVEPIKDAPKNGELKFILDGHQMKMSAHVMTSPKDFVDVNGTFKLIRNRSTDMYIKTTEHIDLVKAKKVLMPLREIFKFELGPIPMMDVPGGYGNANFHITGSKQDPHAWGQINFYDGTASFITINNMVAKNISGWVKFKGDDVDFKTTSLTLNGLGVDVVGNCTMKGDLSVNVRGDGQDSNNLLKIINTSPILKELQDMLKPITYGSGKTKVFLNIFGHVNRGVEPVFNKDLFARGWIEFISNKMTVFPEKVPFSNISGIVNFDKNDGNFKIDANLVDSPISANGVIKNNIVTANAYSNKFNAGDGWKIAKLFYGERLLPIPGIETVSTSFSGHYKGLMDLENFDYSKINAKGKIYSNNDSKAIIKVNNSDFTIKNGHLYLSQIRGLFRNNPFNLQLDVDNILTPKQAASGSFSMKNFNLSALNDLVIPEYPQLKDFDDFEGKIDIASKIKNNNIRLYTQLDGTSVVYRPKHLKLKVLNGNILFDTDDLNINRLNAYAGEMPIFLNGKIKNIASKNPNLNLYVNAKPTQEFFDQFFNSKSVYPIKLKGDVMLVSKLNGDINRLSSKTELKMEENSSLYYMGASLGDMINPVSINVDCLSGKDWIKLNDFKYDKIIASQNGKKFPNTQLIASGGIKVLKDNNLEFRNFKVKTENPTDAKIFNIIFKKPFMKQGVFVSDLLLNGTTLNPKILGTLDVTSIDVPIVDASIKDVSLNFKPDNIYIKVKSSVLENKILLDAVMKNKLVEPYTFNDINLHFDNLDLNVISDAIQDYDATLYKQKVGVEENSKVVDPRQIVIKNATVTADKIKIKELKANDFISHMSIDNKMLAKVNDYKFKLANGTVSGKAECNLLTNILKLSTHIENSNAQTISESLFDMKSQFYGILSGDMNFSCKGKSPDECLRSLSGDGQFIITDGKMPKLGSLEYLLKATNIVSSGITRVSINGIIDLITPLKTGEFKSITGHYNIEDGIVKDLEVFSKGKDLNLYLSGSYNIENYVANMEIYGTLSSNIASVFGKLKNLSLNTLLNTIPFLNNTEYSPKVTEKIEKIPSDDKSSVSRIFAVIVDGDINGYNYVKSFKWVK